MGNQTRPASCPPRPQRTAQSLDPPDPGIPPAAQHPIPACRASDPTARQPRLDADNISLYRHHRCLQALTARHPASPPRLQRGVAHPPVPRHTDGAHEQDQPANKPTTTSANSMTNKTAVVVTRRDGQHWFSASSPDSSASCGHTWTRPGSATAIWTGR
ncbi:hypothetical protein I553_6168 [Mycobacterium xenopi 4042]|uniref:Uncharacterized protein n=1 Tax=Mycobacterium xenopi 4042 TaxID=1299334 RepID=X8BGI2_MYCXE|nr:hypothetical protein I553_6168 [Mycobacterium xenopi 4042]